jgi:hypothetical protein
MKAEPMRGAFVVCPVSLEQEASDEAAVPLPAPVFAQEPVLGSRLGSNGMKAEPKRAPRNECPDPCESES